MDSLKTSLLIAILHFTARLPLAWNRLLGRWLGYLLWWGNGRSRRITEINLELCFPDYSPRQRRRLARQSLQQLGMTIMEAGPAWLWPQQKMLAAVSSVEGEQHLRDAQAQGKGVIVLLPHLGNWEWLNPYLITLTSITALYQPARSSQLDQFIIHARCRFGTDVLPTTASGVKGLLKTLRQGKLIVILPDQEPDPAGGDFAPFFNVPALTMNLVGNLVQRTDARAVCAYVKRDLPGNGFHIVFRPVDNGLYSIDRHTSLTALNSSVEDCVEDCPAQYQWEYKRFSHLPDGSRRRYRPDSLNGNF